jgi:hypothetical protein
MNKLLHLSCSINKVTSTQRPADGLVLTNVSKRTAATKYGIAKKFVCFFVFGATTPPVGQVPLIHEFSRSHTTTHHIRYDSSGRVISSLQRPLPDNTQHSQQTDIHAPGGIRTHNLSRRAAADPRLRLRSHWDRQQNI